MKAIQKYLSVLFITGIFLIILQAFTPKDNPPAKWNIPEEYHTMKNPAIRNSANLEEGKSLYTTHCTSCHGISGKGDGSKAKHLKMLAGDLSTISREQKEGLIFYKIKNGRNGLHSYKGKLSDDEIWTVVLYMKELK